MHELIWVARLALLDRFVQNWCKSFLRPSEISNYITCIVYQSYLVFQSIYNLNYDQSSHAIESCEKSMIGYFLYDTLVLLSKRGRKQIPFLIHHAISILILSIQQYHPTNIFLAYWCIILLELTNPLTNFWHIIRQIESKQKLAQFILSVTKVSYMINRLCGFGLWLWVYIMYYYKNSLSHNISLSGFLTIYGASIMWYKKLKKL